MKPGIPWSVKGIDNDARAAAKHAARRSGMTLGEWLNTVIREQADDSEALQKPPPRPAMHDIQSKLDHLSEQLTRMAGRDQTPAAARHFERGRPAPEQSLAAIVARIEASEREAAANYARFGERLETLGSKFAGGRESFPRNPEDVPGYRSLETAIRNIVDHIEVSERKAHGHLKAMQERVNDIAYIASAPVDHDGMLADAPVIARIENRIADLSSRMSEKDAGSREDFRKLVQSEFGKLTVRIDQVKHAADAAAEQAHAQAVQQAQKDLRDFEDRMEDLLAAVRAPQEVGRLRTEMEGLGQRVDDLTSEAASEQDLRALRAVVEQLSARIAQGLDLGPLTDLDRRLTEMKKLVEHGRSHHAGNQIAELEQRILELDRRIAETMRPDHAAQAWAGVEREFAGLNHRLTVTEQKLQNVAGLEQSIHQFYQSVEQSRDWVREMAEDAANRMATRLRDDWQVRGTAGGPSSELLALQTALESVRIDHEMADQRNQQTLRAVHETLEQIINKLTEVEQLRGGQQVVTLEDPVSAAAPEISLAPEGEQGWSDFTGERGAASDAPLDPAPAPLDEPVPAVHDDFIAAARRAAQAAARQASGPSASGLLNSQAKLLSRFSFRFRRRERPGAQPVQPASAVPAAGDKADPGKHRHLLLIGILLLAAVSAYAYNSHVNRPVDAPAPGPKVEETKPSESSGGRQDLGMDARGKELRISLT